MIKVSVIVPVYNVEQYIGKCLETLVSQTLDEIEIIIVNDGTKDQSQKIVDYYLEKYPNKIKSFIKENGGLSSARNFGLQKAQGEYVAFVDSDDYVTSDMYEKMYVKAKEIDFDLVVCDFNEIREEKIIPCLCHLETDLHDKKAIKQAMVNFYPSAWNKLFKKSSLDTFLFKEGVWFEDVEFIYRVLPYLNSIGYVKGNFYQYLIREGSITSSIDPRIYHYISNWNGLITYYQEHNIYEEYKEILEYCYVRYIYATFIKTATKYPKDEFSKAVKLAIDNVNTQFPNYKRNKYIKNISGKNLYLKYFNKQFSKIIYFKLH